MDHVQRLKNCVTAMNTIKKEIDGIKKKVLVKNANDGEVNYKGEKVTYNKQGSNWVAIFSSNRGREEIQVPYQYKTKNDVIEWIKMKIDD
jgi:hypothetical protein